MDPREQRGLIIAATQKLTNKGKVWLVPSQSGKGQYTVCPDPETPFCSCPDHADHGGYCKHLYAVRITVTREQGADGTVTETKSITFTEKRTFKRDWPTYTLSQTTEKHRLQELLFDLCRGIEEPAHAKTGRKPTPMADRVFASAFKVYTTVSSRRFGCDLEDAHGKGYVGSKLHPCVVCRYLEDPLMTPILEKLVAVSAGPLNAVERTFAVDSSGFSTSKFVRWFDEKYGCVRKEHHWVKAHLVCGTKTGVVTAIKVMDKDSADCPRMPELVKTTAERFILGDVLGDKAYLSLENMEAVCEAGGTPVIQFKVNTTGAAGGIFEKMFHYYSMNKAEYLDRYHQRSNVESTFSAIKRKFGDSVRSKTETAMRNEVLCKVLCHNLCCLILSQCELGIEPEFWAHTVSKA